MKLLIIFVSTISIAIAAFFLVTQTRLGVKVVHAEPALTEFTATIRTQQYSSASQLMLTDVIAVAVKGDGSRAEKRIIRNGNPLEVRTVIDTAAAKKTVIDVLTESKTTYRLTDKEVIAYRHKPSSCTPGNQQAETSTLLGYAVVKVVTNETAGQPSVRKVQWRAPALNCFPLKTEAQEVMADGSLGSSSIEEVTNLSLGTPERSIFEIPANYQERSPSSVMERARELKGQARCEDCKAGNRKLDEVYQASR
jgi:hypothetical protein